MLRCLRGLRIRISELGAEDVLGRFAEMSVEDGGWFCELVSYMKALLACMRHTAS
jgi:hypothetical protein